ncbi:FAD-dependent monooxygenase [Aquihabitans daechungensis]|uniref:FAD-dependent monooxygenase n=1 Tax=Aquihabitans daechungensis TaxID=1052257 RepID=UPI003BA0C9A7
MRTTDHAVVIAGSGPTGLMLAGELALGGADVIIVEPRADQSMDGSRAGGLHSRTIEVLDQRGIADRFLEAGEVAQTQGFAYIRLDIGDFPTRFNHGLMLWQSEFEPILADWVQSLGVRTLRERQVTGLVQDEAGVDVELSDGLVLRAAYLVGCDGGRSTVRRLAGIELTGLDPSASFLIAQVELDEPEIGVRPEGGGIGPVDRTGTGGPYGVVLKEREVEHTGDPTFEDLREALVHSYGTDFGAWDPIWISRFTDASRQAVAYRAGRVLLAGDAAHLHPPHGGQGLNTGVQDAVNLGWKLARVVEGSAPESLLDTYQAERHPVGAQVLRNTEAQIALTTPDDRHQSLRATMADLLALDDGRRHVAGMMSGLSIRYDLGGGHPLVGWRMPDLDLETEDGSSRVFALLQAARPVLLDLGDRGGFDLAPWADRVDLVRATTDGPWDLPVHGPVPAPAAVLIRPDGHVAWAGDPADPSLREALTTWFGPPATS